MSARDDVLAEEIAWLRGFGWSVQRIAQRLRVREATVDYYVHGRGSLTPDAARAYLSAREYAREARVVANDARLSRHEASRAFRKPLRIVSQGAADPDTIAELVDAICPPKHGRSA